MVYKMPLLFCKRKPKTGQPSSIQTCLLGNHLYVELGKCKIHNAMIKFLCCSLGPQRGTNGKNVSNSSNMPVQTWHSTDLQALLGFLNESS